MKKKKAPKLAYYFFLLLSIVGAACSATGGNVADSSVTDTTSDSNEPASLQTSDNGGYTSANETPFFGLDSMKQFGADTPADSSGSAALTAEDAAGAEVYMVRIVWGNLELDLRNDIGGAETDDHLDWSGSLSLTGNGELHLERTILFEEPHDHIIQEEDPKLIEWVSHTGPHVDGMLVKVIYLPSPDAEAPALTFETESATQLISLSELDRYNEIVTLDEDGHGFAFTALRTDDNTCPEGFIEGKFHDRPEGEGGIFRGRVLTDEGELNGHVRGHYGVRDGNQVFFGKYINTEGLFQGFLHGTYGDGAMSGDWTADDGALEGTVSAKYVQGATVDSGFFQGYWQESCE